MQFGFKNNHSTVLCTAVYIETVNHYMKGVVMLIAALLMQARLLTGCTGGGGLFSTLIEKKVSFIFFRLIFDSHIR